MLLPFFLAQTPEEIILRLLGGPGIIGTLLTSAGYQAMSMQLNAAAAATEGSMTQMSGSWQGLSADQAQLAFRNHAMWLREQAAVAAQTGVVADQVANIYSGAQGAMEGVAAWLVQFRMKEAALIGASALGAPAAPAILAAQEMEYLAIKAAATGVMVSYAAALIPTLAALPPPVEAPPIITGGDPGMQMDYSTYDVSSYNGTDHTTGTTQTTTTSDTGNTDTGKTDTGNTDTGGNDNGGGTDNTPTDPNPTDPTNSATPTDPDQLAPQADPGALNGDSGANGLDYGSTDPMELVGTSQYSTTLAGLNGGIGSLVALNMFRGGIGSMPGASTGFRMPANWNMGAGRAFGATPQQPGAGPMGRRQGPPRGAVAPKSRMRRRRDDEKKPSKVFVPGEPQEVPVLEKAPVIGVIEYADGNGRDEPVLEPVLAVGVIERVEDELVPASAERPR